jgi:DUF1009 family protein
VIAMSASPGPIGLIAGNGAFPVEFARAVRASGRDVVVVAHEGETDRKISSVASDVTWIKLGQVGRIIEVLKQRRVAEAVMLGGITKASFFAGARPDMLGLRLLASVAVRSDDNLLRTIAKAFEDEGIRVVSSTPYLTSLTAPKGVFGRHQPSAEELADVEYGFTLAKNLGRFDVGQSVVVKERVALALEAIEGTDACIKRGATLGKSDTIVVKVVKPNQDHRFDLPAAGPRTVEVCREHKVRVLAVEAGGTLLMDRERMVTLADKAGIVLIGVCGEAQS